MKQNKIVFMIGQLSYGGSEKQIFNLCNNGYKPYEVIIICLSNDLIPFGIDLKERGYKVLHPINVSTFNRFLWLFRILLKYRLSLFIIVSVRPYSVFMLPLMKIKYIYNERSLGVWKRKYHIFFDCIIHYFAECIVTNSKATRDFLVKYQRVAPTKIIIIYNGIDKIDNVSSPKNNKKDVVWVTIVSGMRPWKGYSFLLQGIIKYISKFNNKVLFNFVGDGSEREKIEKEIAKNKLHNYIKLWGWVNNPVNLIAKSDIIINTSSHESLSNSIMEGMLHGKPVIATDVGGNKELVHNRLNGYLIHYGDTVKFADCLQTLISDELIRNNMGIKGQEIISNNFNMDKMVENYKGIISYYSS